MPEVPIGDNRVEPEARPAGQLIVSGAIPVGFG